MRQQRLQLRVQIFSMAFWNTDLERWPDGRPLIQGRPRILNPVTYSALEQISPIFHTAPMRNFVSDVVSLLQAYLGYSSFVNLSLTCHGKKMLDHMRNFLNQLVKGIPSIFSMIR